MIKKIYLDMDGVIANFEKRYTEMFLKTPKEARDKKEFNPHWTEFVMTEQFKTLDWWPDGEKFLEFIKTLDIEVEILSSSGGAKYHSLVEKQKLYWLEQRGIFYKANIVSGRRKKKEYATPDSILVDDTLDVIEDFNAAGGIGILHKDADETIKIIKSLINKN